MTSGLVVSCINHEDIIVAIAFSPDGRYFATGSEDSTAKVWEANTGNMVACLTHEDSINNVAFSPDNNYLVTLTGSKLFPQSVHNKCSAIIWDISTGRKVISITHDYGVNAIAFNPNGKSLAIASSDGVVGVWEAIISHKVVDIVRKYEVKLNSSLAFLWNKGDTVIVRCDQSGWVWKANTSLAIVRMKNDYPIVAVSFNASGQHLATASLDGTARVWEVTSGREIARMTHEKQINFITFSPDGKHLATASEDRTARIWKVVSAQEIARVTHNDKVNAVAFSPDGKLLATVSGDLMSGSSDYTARLWLWRRADDLISSSYLN